MNYGARLAQRSVKIVGRATRQAQVNIQMQLAHMQCERLGHVPGKRLSNVGAYRKEIAVCSRCWRVIDEKGSETVHIGESENDKPD